MSDTAQLLRLQGVWMQYPGVDGATPPPVLRDIDLTVAAGESLAIVGPSGCGKSTLLNIIGTLDRPTAGHVYLDGQDLATLDDRALATVRNRRIGFVFQAHHLLPQCTVLENVLIPTLARTAPVVPTPTTPAQPRVLPPPPTATETPDSRARRLLQRVGLSHRLHHRPGQLSGGERQRAAVVRALINRPTLLLADEPTGALDRAASDNLATLLIELNREEHVALIVVTHAADLARRMSRVYTLVDGLLQQAQG